MQSNHTNQIRLAQVKIISNGKYCFLWVNPETSLDSFLQNVLDEIQNCPSASDCTHTRFDFVQLFFF